MTKTKLYVGIDVSNAKVDVAFLDKQVRTVRPQATYPNMPAGWVELADAVVAACAKLGPDVEVVCGMESTSNMHKRLEQALRREKRCKIEVHVLNPLAVKHFAKVLLKDTKTDRIDSHVIAQFLLRMQPEPAAEMPDEFEEFKEATRTRRRLIEERTATKNRLHKLLRYHFPGYREVVGKHLSQRLLTVLSQMPSPHALLERTEEELADIRYGRRHRVGGEFAGRLHELAGQAPRLQLPEVTQMLVRTTAERILEINTLLGRLDKAIGRMLERLFPDQVLTSIPGLGAVSAAAILAEVGDVGRFDSKEQFVGYCGLYPIVWESGEAKRRYRMTWKGNRMLKMTLLVSSAAARQYNPVISAFYERLRRRDKSTKAAGGAIARKMAELVFTLLVRNEPWSADKASRGMQKAEAMLKKAA